MRLTLDNFGIWNKKEFVFPDDGLTLLSGPSGRGKTTIFRAINYALTGKGNKIATIGEKKCLVTFSYKDLEIKRCNTPNRLTVSFNGFTYEGEEAQSIIYQKIGKNFEIAGYIQQKGENSFLGMSPADKLLFLEKVAFADVPIDDIKEKSREMVNICELKLVSVQGELKYLHDNPVEKPDNFPHDQESISITLQSLKESNKLLSVKKEQLEKKLLEQLLLQEKSNGLVQRITDIQIQEIPDKIPIQREEDELKGWKLYEDYQKEKDNIADLEIYLQRNQGELKYLHDNPVEKPDNFPHDQESISITLQSLKESNKLLSVKKEQLEKKLLEQLLLQEKCKDLIKRIADIQIQEIPDKIPIQSEENELKGWKLYEDYQKEKDNIVDLENYLQRNQGEINLISEKLNSLKLYTVEEKRELNNELEELTTSLREYKSQQEMKKVIDSFSLERYNNLIVSISDSEEKLRFVLQSRETRMCPSCKVHLRIIKDKLEVFSGLSEYSSYSEKDLRDQINMQKQELMSLEMVKLQIEKFKPIIEEIELNPEEVEQAIQDLYKIRNEREDIEKTHKDLTKDRNRLKNDVNIAKIKEKVEAFNKKTNVLKPGRTKQELEKLISIGKLRDIEIERIRKENIENQRKREALEIELNSFSKLKDSRGIKGIEQELIIISNQLHACQCEQEKYTQLEKEFQLYKQQLSEYSSYINSIDRLKNDVNIAKIKEKVEAFNKKTNVLKPGRAKQELEKLISISKLRDIEIERIRKENIENQRKREALETELNSFSKLKDIRGIKGIEQELIIISNQLHESQCEQEKYTQLEKELQLYQQQLTEYSSYINSIDHIKKSLNDAEKKFTMAKKFKENLKTAEMLALNGLIEEINSHLSTYLSVFFPDNPLTLDLCLFKTNEKTKIVRNQINIQVGYRGVSTDLTTLSGGEKDRVNLAFTLALAEIFSIPLLMLDETLSSLDRETTENILEHIQKDSRSILIVAHQVSSGLFDHVYNI